MSQIAVPLSYLAGSVIFQDTRVVTVVVVTIVIKAQLTNTEVSVQANVGADKPVCHVVCVPHAHARDMVAMSVKGWRLAKWSRDAGRVVSMLHACAGLGSKSRRAVLSGVVDYPSDFVFTGIVNIIKYMTTFFYDIFWRIKTFFLRILTRQTRKGVCWLLNVPETCLSI